MKMEDDEISLVLQQFQPRPEFVVSKGSIQTDSGFSSIQYNGDVLKLSYLTNRVILLKFEVTIAKPHMVKCVYMDNDNISYASKLRKLVDVLCSKINSPSSADSSADSANSNCGGSHKNAPPFRLFVVVSKLLFSLNNLPPCGNLTNEERTEIIESIVSKSSTMHCKIWDLQILLLRCAAAGRHSTNFCSPIPKEFKRGESGWGIGERILAATQNINSTELQSLQRILHPQEQAILGMLHSLPWTERGTLTKESTSKTASTIKLSFDLQSVIGEPSPRFASLASQRGVTTVYHGTKMENVWSILNCGLWSLSDTKFCKHGSLMGKGVYFSTSYKTASFFALNEARNCTNSEGFQKAWLHLSLVNVLSLTSASVLEDYVVSCYPVFEAEIILPPDDKKDRKSTDDRGDCTRRDGNYFVVPNSWDIRITKLHLTFDFERKTSMSRFLLMAVLALLALGWMRM